MTIEDLKKKSVAEIRELAKVLGIEFDPKAKKSEIIALITGAVESAPKATESKTEIEPVQTEDSSPAEGVNTTENEKEVDEEKEPVKDDVAQENNINDGKPVKGIFEQVTEEAYGFLRVENFYQNNQKDIYVTPSMIKKFGLRNGDLIDGFAKAPKDRNKTNQRDNLIYIKTVNGLEFKNYIRRPHFEKLTPIYPDFRYKLENDPKELSTRIIDIMSPIGKGQRGLVVSPPKAGKTVLLKAIANAISKNYPETELIVLLIDERPEEVTDIAESINGTVVASCFDEMPERHVKVSELTLQYAQRLVECKKDVVILMDSITRLARAYNMTITPTGRSLSGGLDPAALYGPKKFFGAARNIREGGSLTIVATALVETGSKLDDVIYEEFKGTGNMELHLDRSLSERRIFPAIDVRKSGTRREDLLLNKKELEVMYAIRKELANYQNDDAASRLLLTLERSKTNDDMLDPILSKLNK